MIFALITLLCAVLLSSIAAYYSVIGLMAIFATAPIPIAIMGGALEFSKLIAASWAYKNWTIAPRFLKYYFVVAVIILMFITSLGIFGYLSKAHSDQNLVSGDVSAQIALIDEKIKIEKDSIDVNRRTLKQMDEAVDQIMARSTTETGASKAANLRKTQQAERNRILKEIESHNKTISVLNDERSPIATQIRKVEAEVGPIKYIASLLYDSVDSDILDKSVRFVIILLVLVFDPMAVLLVIAGNFSLRQLAKEKEEKMGNYEVNIPMPVVPRKRKQKVKPEKSNADENLEASVVEPIPMTKEELEEFKKKYTRDGRPKFAKYLDM